ncbi:MAG: Fic family protein [Gammaproteobacteria bacterium]|nr:Fic family protein [Gammaproteobacteria bacterium]MDH5803397.1 Fic family protein [Gammaproteobacteria bacterium]
MSQTPCLPDSLPIQNLDWRRLASYCSKATLAVARYDGTLAGMVNAVVLLSPITNREAVLSSRIEGTQASLVEVLQHEAGEEYTMEKQGDIDEIINYRRALLMAEKELEKRPISLQLIRQLHSVLMENVRGGDQTPGSFRTIQNWIGPRGCRIEQARFVPPTPIIMQSSMTNLEQYILSDDVDPLVQLAVLHAQFEIIHPFKDGNGRLGRMLVPLFLYQKNVLQRPMFYLSEYLEENDSKYRDRLLAITDDGDWQGWVEFFLQALHQQAERNTERAKNIHQLYDDMKQQFVDATHSQFALPALDAFFSRPIMNAPDFIKISGVSNRGTANGLLKQLLNKKLIKIVRPSSGRRPTIYAFPSLINIAEGRDVF